MIVMAFPSFDQHCHPTPDSNEILQVKSPFVKSGRCIILTMQAIAVLVARVELVCVSPVELNNEQYTHAHYYP